MATPGSLEQALELLKADRESGGEYGPHRRPDDDDWLRNRLRAAIIEHVIEHVGFQEDPDGIPGNGFGEEEVDRERWIRILTEIAHEPIMKGIRIKVGTLRLTNCGTGEVTMAQTWKAYFHHEDTTQIPSANAETPAT